MKIKLCQSHGRRCCVDAKESEVTFCVEAVADDVVSSIRRRVFRQCIKDLKS